MKSLKDITEGVAVSSDFKLVNSVNAQGKPITRKVRAHRKTISAQSEDKSDVMTSIQKFVGRQYDEEVEVEEGLQQKLRKIVPGYAKRQINKKMDDQKFGRTDVDKDANYYRYKKLLDQANEEVEQVDEIDMSKTLAAFNKGKPAHAQAKIDTRTTAERKAETEKMLSARAAAKPKFKPQPIKPSTPEQQMKNQNDAMAKSYASHKRGQYVGDSVELTGTPIVEVRSAAARLQLALQKARKQREEEEARKAANEKRALTPKPTNEANIEPTSAKSRSHIGNLSNTVTNSVVHPSSGKEIGIITKQSSGEYHAQHSASSLAHQKSGTFDSKDKAHRFIRDAHAKAIKNDTLSDRWKKSKPLPQFQSKETNEAKDPREYDYEGDMAKTQLRSIIANSQAVHDMLKDTTNLAEWVQSKITKAEDYISTVADYMTAEMNESKEEDDDEDYTKHHKLDPDSGVEADQHIHVQLKKAIDSTMKPYEVTFKNGKKHSVSSPVAKTIVTAVEKLKPEHRKAVHDELHKSYDSLMGVHKAITGK